MFYNKNSLVKRMKNIVYVLITLIICGVNSFAQGVKKVSNKNDSLFYDGKLDLNIVASTRKNNPKKSPYETTCENPPKPIDKTFLGTGFYLKLDTNRVVKDKNNACYHKLLVINNTDSSMAFGNIDILPEVLIDGKWEQVEETKYEMMFFCRTDDYKVILDSKEYWGFNVPVFKGNYKTKLRYTLYYENEYVDFSSNEIDVYFNKAALDNKYLKLDSTTNYLREGPLNKNESVMSLDRMNVVYTGLTNPITIAIPGSTSELVVRPSCGKILKGSKNGSFNLTFDSAYNKERELEILVYIKTDHDSLNLKGKHHFRIRPIPEPSIMLGSIDKSGVYSPGVIRAAEFVFLNLYNFAFDGVKFTPLEYTLTYKKLDGQSIELKGKGAVITKEMRRLFNHAKSKDRFILGKITALGPNGIVKIDKELIVEVK